MQDEQITDFVEKIAVDETGLDETPEEQIKREKEAVRQRSARLRRRIIPILAICLALLILLPLLLTLGLNLLADEDDTPTYRPIEFPDYSFSPVYDGDILQYDRYLAQNRRVYFYSNPQGVGDRYQITEEEADARLNLIYHYLQSIINGDADAYNSFFNLSYFQSNAKKEAFPQQMLYNINVYFYAEEYDEASGERLYTYQIDYMILQNNGKFRNDIGSDMIRSQYMVIRKYANGTVKIENLLLKRMAEQVE